MKRTRRTLLLPVMVLANAPGIFQDLMSVVLHDLGNFAIAY